MSNTCKVTESKISVKFELADVTLSTYIKIAQFIESLGVGMETSTEAAASATAHQTPVAPKAEKPTKPDALPADDKYARVGQYAGWQTVVQIFKDADANPDKYVYIWQTAKAWMKKFDELKDEGVFPIAHILGSLATNDLLKRAEQYNKSAAKREVLFYCPVRRANSEVAPPSKALTDGESLRNARISHSLTYEDVHVLTGYDTDTIAKWECGKYTMSSEAKREIIKAFGEDIFAKAKKEVA